MTHFKFTHDWLAVGNDSEEYLHTMAHLALHIGSVNLMQNEDIWARTIRDNVLVSAYPLAMWLASSWWRLNYEPLPAHDAPPSVDWRMAHELGAADHGFVWPQIIFASDCEAMQVWAAPSKSQTQQSVRYLNGLDKPTSVTLKDFQHGVEQFIDSVLSRLDAVGCPKTDLWNLWQILQEERAEPASLKYRRIEAEMGYDPDECPEALMNKAQALEQRIGAATLSELAPVYGKSANHAPLDAIEEIAAGQGLIGQPNAPRIETTTVDVAPWQHAVAAAGSLRQKLSNSFGQIENSQLYDLLGLTASGVEQWTPSKRNNAAIAVPCDHNKFKFIPRKKHPLAKRFELARFLGDYILKGQTEEQWLTSTDLTTSRQKYQRAFAAEFLCPISALLGFLENDFSESAIEDAAQHFDVSQTTVNALLKNNGLISPAFAADYIEDRLPYSLSI